MPALKNPCIYQNVFNLHWKDIALLKIGDSVKMNQNSLPNTLIVYDPEVIIKHDMFVCM